MDLIFDLETNGLLDTLTRIHCLWIEDVETGERVGYGPNEQDIKDGVERLVKADRIIGHNILKFDIPAINKLYDFGPMTPLRLTIDRVGTRYIDTMVCTRLIWADIRETDAKRAHLPGKLKGTHKLAAWGHRFGVMKGDYEGGWDTWNQEMHDYCGQDAAVTRELWKRILARNTSEQALLLEHQFAFCMAEMEANGFGFDEAKAAGLYSTLVGKRTDLAAKLATTFGPEVIEETFIPKGNLKSRGYVKGVPFIKRHTVEFNPSSRQMISRRLQALGWKPEEFTDSGQAKVDETILATLPYPEAKLLAEHFLTEKRIGQIAEGDQAWLKVNKNGVIHGSINPNGAVTGRCTHSRPNISQVPKVGSPLGAECRACFRPTRPGWSQVGVDLSGLELRCLAHFMGRYDGGAYGRILLEGDVHKANAISMGLILADCDPASITYKIMRGDIVKRVIYAFLYGAGNAKLGSLVSEGITNLRDAGEPWEDVAKRYPGTDDAIGKKLKARFLKSLPALKSLIEQVQETARKQGFLKGLDGRRLRVRSPHSALNTLLQSAGALIAKKATVIAYQNLHKQGFVWGRDWGLMAHVHDEVQIECRPEITVWVGEAVVDAMEMAGREFGFRIAITGEHHAGNNWAETH